MLESDYKSVQSRSVIGLSARLRVKRRPRLNLNSAGSRSKAVVFGCPCSVLRLSHTEQPSWLFNITSVAPMRRHGSPVWPPTRKMHCRAAVVNGESGMSDPRVAYLNRRHVEAVTPVPLPKARATCHKGGAT
jgi:hypothetical protein